jgi:hypothetical protein
VKPLVLDDEADGEYQHAVGVYAAENFAVAVRFTERVEEALTRMPPSCTRLSPKQLWCARMRECG